MLSEHGKRRLSNSLVVQRCCHAGCGRGNRYCSLRQVRTLLPRTSHSPRLACTVSTKLRQIGMPTDFPASTKRCCSTGHWGAKLANRAASLRRHTPIPCAESHTHIHAIDHIESRDTRGVCCVLVQGAHPPETALLAARGPVLVCCTRVSCHDIRSSAKRRAHRGDVGFGPLPEHTDKSSVMSSALLRPQTTSDSSFLAAGHLNRLGAAVPSRTDSVSKLTPRPLLGSSTDKEEALQTTCTRARRSYMSLAFRVRSLTRSEADNPPQPASSTMFSACSGGVLGGVTDCRASFCGPREPPCPVGKLVQHQSSARKHSQADHQFKRNAAQK